MKLVFNVSILKFYKFVYKSNITDLIMNNLETTGIPLPTICFIHDSKANFLYAIIYLNGDI